MKDPQEHERLLAAIRELTAEVRRMVERIRQQLRDMEKKGLRKSDGPARRQPREKPPS